MATIIVGYFIRLPFIAILLGTVWAYMRFPRPSSPTEELKSNSRCWLFSTLIYVVGLIAFFGGELYHFFLWDLDRDQTDEEVEQLVNSTWNPDFGDKEYLIEHKKKIYTVHKYTLLTAAVKDVILLLLVIPFILQLISDCRVGLTQVHPGIAENGIKMNLPSKDYNSIYNNNNRESTDTFPAPQTAISYSYSGLIPN